MSIFKETLEDSIQTQLQARTLVVSGINNNRNQLLPWYLSKNSWVRMTSFVNFTSGKELKTNNKGKLEPKPDEVYVDNQLSKKYILEGGTLYTRSTGTDLQDSILRYGIGSPQSVYGGNIDVRANNTADPEYFRTFGIRPMPGITDVDLRTVGAYGSLFETTVKFYAWDINQLNELEILFMRPGYSVLLEWGWSQYIDYGDNLTGSKATLEASSIYPTVFNGVTINPFESLSQDDIYKKLEVLRKKYRHNYDGMLGYVKNFNWTMMTNGGFECTTTLISMGEAINTIKISSNTSTKKTNIVPDSTGASNYVYDEYENILLSLKAKVDSKNYSRLDKQEVLTLEENEYKGSWDYNQNFIGIDKIKETVIKYYPDQSARLGFDQIPYLQEVVFQEPSDTGRFFEYLPLDTWLAIVNSYFNVKTNNIKGENNIPLVKFELPKENDLCLACKDSISIDPKICQVKNQGAFKEEMSFVGFNGSYTPSVQGINPPMYFINNSGIRKTLTDDSFKFYDESLKAGKIRNILVNISFLLSAYKDMKNNSNDEGVILLDYIKNVLNKISNSLGGLNNFNLSTVSKNHNTTKVVDLYYLESGANNNYTSKYQFDLLGLNSICRNVNIQSQIFENQSTIVAIAAQSRANLANVYNSSQVYLNAGLEDRLALNKWQGEEDDEIQGNINDVFYQKLYNLMLYARDYLIGNFIQGRNTNDQYQISVDTSGQANPNSILKQSMLKYNSELNFKALIPFKLRITLDGIGGIVVGQIFTLKQNILPKNYYDKKLGFVITQINHRLSKNDWETELETQICILDQEVNPSLKNFINIDRNGFKDWTNKIQSIAVLYPILIDFLSYQATKCWIGFMYAAVEESNVLTIGEKSNFNEVMFDYFINNLDKEVIQEYWVSNTPNFLYSNNGYSIADFRKFIKKWTESYKLNYPTESSTLITNDGKTLINLFYYINNPTITPTDNYEKELIETLNSYIDQVQADLKKPSNWELFYPNINNNNFKSLYAGDDGRLQIGQQAISQINNSPGIFYSTTLTEQQAINGFNLKTQQDRLQRFINIAGGPLREVKRAWDNRFPLENTQNKKYLDSIIGSNSQAIWGTINSIVPTSNNISYKVDKYINGPLNISNTATFDPGIHYYPNSIITGNTIAGHIDWERTFGKINGINKFYISSKRGNIFTNVVTNTDSSYYNPK